MKVLVSSEANRYSPDKEKRDTKDPQHKSHQGNADKNDATRQQQRNSNDSDPYQHFADNLEFFFKLFVELSKKIGQQMKRIFRFILTDMRGNQAIDRCVQWCVQHPQMSICLLAVGLVISFPFLLFTGFALSTIVMTFTGFLVLEGTLLTILTMIMFGALGALGIALLFFSLVGAATYFGVSHVYDMYGNTEVQRSTLRNVMQGNNRNLNSTPVATKNSFETTHKKNFN